MQPEFQIGSIYRSTTHGLVEYKGIDNYMGDVTLHFYSLTYKQNCYWYPDEKALSQHFDLTNPNIASTGQVATDSDQAEGTPATCR